MGILSVVFKLSLLLALAGCSGSFPSSRAVRPTAPAVVQAGPALQGEYQDLAGETRNLTEDTGQNLVLIFAQDTCAVCAEEADHLVERVRREGSPQSFAMRHLLVGAFPEDAREWIQRHQISWSAGTARVDLFRQYCPELQVPCVVSFRAGEGQVDRQVGKVQFSKIEEVLGLWSTN